MIISVTDVLETQCFIIVKWGIFVILFVSCSRDLISRNVLFLTDNYDMIVAIA